MNANLMTKKIEMTKNEAKEAGKLNSEKFHELRQYMAIYPGFEVQIKAPSKRKVELGGLDYKYMKTYILNHDDEAECLLKWKELPIGCEKRQMDSTSNPFGASDVHSRKHRHPKLNPYLAGELPTAF